MFQQKNLKKYNIKPATDKDAELVKSLINKMYRSEYEKRGEGVIASAITQGAEIYVLSYVDNQCVGFAGASLNNDYYANLITPDVAVIDYIYVEPSFRSIAMSYDLIVTLFSILTSKGVQSAIMQVQTFNKQRFFHYALSDGNIIQKEVVHKNGQTYEDQILLIKDLSVTLKMTMKQLMAKAHKYKTECQDTKKG